MIQKYILNYPSSSRKKQNKYSELNILYQNLILAKHLNDSMPRGAIQTTIIHLLLRIFGVVGEIHCSREQNI